MEDEPIVPWFPVDHLAEAIELDRAGSALDMRRARLLAVLKRMDLRPLGYSSFKAFCKVEVPESDIQVRQYVKLAECPFALVRAAVVEGRVPASVAILNLRNIDPAGEQAWVEDAAAGAFRRRRPDPPPEVEFTGQDVLDITAARALARVNAGCELSDPQADRHILASWTARESRTDILKKAFSRPPAPSPLPPWVGADPAEAFLGPWRDPTDVHDARAQLYLATGLRNDRTRLLAIEVEFICQTRAYRDAGYASLESWARHCLSVDIRTVQRYRAALDAWPDLDLDRALFLEEVATEDTRAEWREIVPRVPAAELQRAREAARLGAEDVIRRAYSSALAELDVMPTETTLPRFVSLAALLPPPPAPRATTAHPDLPEAARWYLAQARTPSQRGIGRIKARNGHTCANPECACRHLRLHVHHRMPRAQGGSDADENLDVLCPGCHLRLRHGGHMKLEARGKWLVFTFVDREIWVAGYPGLG